LVYKGNPLGLHSYEDIPKNPKAKVAVLSGSVEEAMMLKLGCTEAQIIRVPDAVSGRAAVRAQKADALALSAPTLRWMVAHPIAGVTEFAELLTDDDQPIEASRAIGAFAFRKRDQSLLKAWNAELDRFVGSPEHLRLVERFGFTSEELPARSSPKGAH
jgi:polar amino acid transport system substrate-binding protein